MPTAKSGAGRQFRRPARPVRRVPGEGLRLPRPKRRAGLDEPEARGGEKARHRPRRPERVAHQRPPPRTELDEHEGVGPPLVVPDLRQPQADELAEHLADLGRGGEVPRGAERVAGRVVAEARVPERQRHEGVEPQRALARRSAPGAAPRAASRPGVPVAPPVTGAAASGGRGGGRRGSSAATAAAPWSAPTPPRAAARARGDCPGSRTGRRPGGTARGSSARARSRSGRSRRPDPAAPAPRGGSRARGSTKRSKPSSAAS